MYVCTCKLVGAWLVNKVPPYLPTSLRREGIRSCLLCGIVWGAPRIELRATRAAGRAAAQALRREGTGCAPVASSPTLRPRSSAAANASEGAPGHRLDARPAAASAEQRTDQTHAGNDHDGAVS